MEIEISHTIEVQVRKEPRTMHLQGHVISLQFRQKSWRAEITLQLHEYKSAYKTLVHGRVNGGGTGKTIEDAVEAARDEAEGDLRRLVGEESKYG